MLDYNLIKSLLNYPTEILLISHRNPDGDAIGSCLSLYHILKGFGHNVVVVVPSDFPNIYDFLPGSDSILVYDHQREKCEEVFKKSKFIFYLDFSDIDRIDPFGISLLNHPAKSILIDHHIDPQSFTDFILSNTQASSTCELVYDFIVQMGWRKEITSTIGLCIFTGIITDTGGFKFSTNSNIYRIAAELKDLGIDDTSLNDLLFNSYTVNQLALLGHTLANRIIHLPNNNAAIIYLTKEDYQTFRISRGDTEGIVNYVLMIKNIKIAAFVREMPTALRISFRSKGDVSVQELANRHFSGGGHKNAAGGTSNLSLVDTIEKIKSIIPNYVK